MASMRKTVLPVWLEAKAWKSGKETASLGDVSLVRTTVVATATV